MADFYGLLNKKKSLKYLKICMCLYKTEVFKLNIYHTSLASHHFTFNSFVRLFNVLKGFFLTHFLKGGKPRYALLSTSSLAESLFKMLINKEKAPADRLVI